MYDARLPWAGDPRDFRDGLFLAAIEAEIRTALRAFDRLTLLLVRLGDMPTQPPDDTAEEEWDEAERALTDDRWNTTLDVWAEVFLVLSATANVSKMFRLSGPARDRAAPVARALRIIEVLGIEDPRAWSRDVRDALEHFDERLDLWLADDPFYWADRLISPAADVAAMRWPDPTPDDWRREVPMRVLRTLDPETLVVEVFGPRDGLRETSVSLREIAVRLQALQERVHAAQAGLPDFLGPQGD